MYVSGKDLAAQGGFSLLDVGKLCAMGKLVAWSENKTTKFVCRQFFEATTGDKDAQFLSEHIIPKQAVKIVLFPFDLEEYANCYQYKWRELCDRLYGQRSIALNKLTSEEFGKLTVAYVLDLEGMFFDEDDVNAAVQDKKPPMPQTEATTARLTQGQLMDVFKEYDLAIRLYEEQPNLRRNDTLAVNVRRLMLWLDEAVSKFAGVSAQEENIPNPSQDRKRAKTNHINTLRKFYKEATGKDLPPLSEKTNDIDMLQQFVI